jgi:PAS domain S-box-containing protein
MKKAARILIVEDMAADAELAERAIRKVLKGCAFHLVETRKDFLKALETFQPDVILADYALPRFDGITALKLARKYAPFTPLIIWTGASREDIAVDCLKAGANNYVLKENIKRLGPAVLRALEDREALLARKQAEEKYQAIFENSVVGIFQSTPRGRYRNVNAAMARIYGYASPEQMIEAVKDIKQQIYVDTRRRSEFIKLLDSQNTVEHYEERNYRRDGSIIWTSTSARTVRDANGNVLYYEGFITDITARKQIEEELKERERQLTILFGNLPGPVYRYRNNANYTMDFISAGIRELSGYAAEDFQQHRRDYGKLIHPQDRERVWAEIQAAVERKQPFELTYRIFTANDEEKWVWEKGQGVYDAQGQLQALEGFITDITARQRTEEVIQNNEKRFRALIENGLDDISLLAADGTLLWESPSTIRNLGYAPGEYVTRNIFEIMHPHDLAWTRKVFAKLVQEPGGHESGIFRLRRSDGTWRWVEAIATNFLNEPGINAVVINYRDITEGKQTEEALREERNLLRTLIDNIPDRIYVMDSQGRKTLSNTADWQASGGKTMEDVIGKTDVDTYPPELAEEFWQHDRAVLDSGQAVINYEEPGLDTEGNRVSILTTKIPLRDSEGKVVGLVGIGRDITERKQVEERINDLLAFNGKILNHSAVGILTYKVSGPCVFANEKAASIVGTTVTQLLSQNFRTIPSWKESGLYDLVESAITTQAPATADIHHFSTFGKNVWMTAHCVTFRAKGEEHVLLSISDITERKEAEEKLRQSESRYRLAVKATNDVIWESNLQTKQLYWSENAQIVFGYTPQEVDSYETWWDDRVHPDDRERVLSKINDLIEGAGSLWMDEYRFQLKNGSYAYIGDRGYIERDHTGTPLRMIGAMTDITERKQAEDKLRESENRLFMALSGAQMSVWEWDLKTNQIFWSPEFFKITGVNENQFNGTFESFTDLIHNDDMERVRNAAEKAMKKQTLFAEEFRIICPDGEVRWLSNLGQAEYDSTGSYLRLIGTVQDVTQRKQAEIERQALLEIMQGFANTEDLHELLQLIHYSVARVVYANNFFVVLYQPETGLFEEIYTVDQYDPPAPPDKLEKSITSYVFRTGEPLLLTQVQFDELVQRGETKLVGTDSASWLGVPLKTSGRTIGVMAVQDYEYVNRYTERDKDFLASIATQVALAIERKQAEEALRESEEHYRAIFEGVQDAIFVESLDGKILMVNKRACEMFGYSQEEFLTKTVKDLVPEGNLILTVDGGTALLSPEPHESLNRRANGETFPIDISGRLQVINGETVLLVVVRDITERKQAEESLRAEREKMQNYLDIAGVMMLALDQEGRVTLINQKGCEILGFSSDEIMGKNWMKTFLSESIRQEVQEVFQELISGGMQLKSYYENPVLTKHGEERLIAWHNTVVRDSQGRIISTLSSGEDITERKQAEYEIRRRAEENSILLKTSLALTNLDLKATLQTVGDSAKNLFAADGCRIFLMEPDGKSLRCVLALQENLDAFSELKIKIGEGVTGTVAASGQAEIVNEMQNDPRSVQVPGTPEEEEAIMFAPLKERDNTIGVLSVRRTSRAWRFLPADLALLEALASMAASAVSNARLFAETQRRLSELEALYENGLAVGRLLKPNQIGNRLIHTFSSYLPWHHVTISLRREASDDLELVAFSLPNLKEAERTNAEQHFVARINKVGQGLSGWVIQTGVPLRTGNVHVYPQYIDTHAGIQSGLYMPLKVGERVIGVISVESELPDAFTEQDERLLATLASQAAIAFENARLYQAIEQELSERRRAEEALRTSETHYRDLADSITDILFELDQDLRYTHWNKASEILSGISAEDAIGRTMRDLFGASDEQSRREDIYESVLKERRARSFETEVLANGEKRALEINAYPSARGVSVVAKDVTDRKRAEIIMQKRFELMEYSARHTLEELMQRTVDEVSELTGSTIGFFHFVQEDQNSLGMQTWSTNALKLFSVPIREGSHLPLDQAGMWAEAVHQRRPLIQNDYEALIHKKGLPQGQVPITREIVIPIIRNERVMAIMGLGNKPQEYTSYDLEVAERLADYAWDITERKQMQVALEMERNQLAKRVEERTTDLSQANSNLARALRVKDEFLANMSHELRTPLNAILGLSESLGEQIAGPLNEKQQKYITTISESGHHLLSLINDILDLAKIEAGQITLDINKVDVHQVCQASLRMIKQLAQKKNQDVLLEIGDGLGLMWADERRLKQMIVNLLGNAVKFTPEHGKIGLEVHGDQGANKITITVWDDGIGIREEDLARLFQPFVQLDSGLAREATGTGLGLALVAQMARLHAGSVSVVSEPGKGSRFSIILPWEPGLDIDTSSRLRITGKFPAIKPDETNKPTILLVEDTKEVIMMIRDYLELAGYKVVIARDGVEAIAQARLVHPDLILMDVMMPRMDGFEATRKLRSEPEFKYTPIIALTALAMPSDRERCLAAGMDEYISKPINLKALVRMIQSCLFNGKEQKPG